MNFHEDTITAIATPVGEGGISVIRISGPEAVGVADARFRGKNSLRSVPSHTAHFGHLVGRANRLIDEVVAVVFRAPHSYTAEDVVEISCHGGLYNTQRILDEIVSAGARLAHPGEFTKRAFLNGRIDLSQAEAVADLIHSRSETLHKTSLSQLEGRLSREIKELRVTLINVCSLLELELDFSEEGIELNDRKTIANDIEEILRRISSLVGSFQLGAVYRDGVKVVLAGRPNVGKSSILNSLLNENRAIVTDIPGTTRDIITESISIDGIIFDLYDTAGLREIEDIIESEGIKKTQESIKKAHILLFVIDSSEGITPDDEEILRRIINDHELESQDFIIVANKIDLKTKNQPDMMWNGASEARIQKLSAKTGEGLEELKKQLYCLATFGDALAPESKVVITNIRHRDALVKSENSLKLVLDGIHEQKTNDFLAPDLRSSISFLGEIIGEVTSEDVLNHIFEKFCIGK